MKVITPAVTLQHHTPQAMIATAYYLVVLVLAGAHGESLDVYNCFFLAFFGWAFYLGGAMPAFLSALDWARGREWEV